MNIMYRLQEYFQCSPCVDQLFCERHMPSADGFERSAMVTKVESNLPCVECERSKRDEAWRERRIQYTVTSDDHVLFITFDPKVAYGKELRGKNISRTERIINYGPNAKGL